MPFPEIPTPLDTPEKAERLPDLELHRLSESNLQPLAQRENVWGTVSYQLDDRSVTSKKEIISPAVQIQQGVVVEADENAVELLPLSLLNAKRFDYHTKLKNPNLTKKRINLKRSEIAVFDKTMVLHAVPRSTQFISKTTPEDTLAVSSVRMAVKLAPEYEIEELVNGLQSVVEEKVHSKQKLRTEDLLQSLKRDFNSLPYDEVWLVIHELEARRTFMAQLVDFLLLETETKIDGRIVKKVVIEPLVRGNDGTVGLFPEGVMLDPFTYFKD